MNRYLILEVGSRIAAVMVSLTLSPDKGQPCALSIVSLISRLMFGSNQQP